MQKGPNRARASREVDRSHIFCRTLSIALVASLTFVGQSFAVPKSDSSSYRLAPGDRISITILGQPEFSGDYMIDNAGSVTLPAIGTVNLKDLAVSQAEQLITERLSNGLLQQPITSVRVSDPRPIYVIGDVRTPGSYPFRYGVSVLSALALAGGLRVAEQIPFGARSEFLLADERLRVLQANRRTLLVRRSRLEGQLKSTEQVILPEQMSKDDAEIARLLREESEILAIQKAGYEQTLKLLRDQIPRLNAEMDAIRNQTQAEARQLELIQSHIADYNNLVSSGLTRRFQLIEYQRQEAGYKSNLARLAAEQVSLEIRKGEISMRMQEAENEYKRKIVADLQDVRSKLEEIEITLPAAREIREARLQQGGITSLAANSSDVSHTAVIHRIRDGNTESFQANPTTALSPGDIVEVRPNSRDTQYRSSSTAKSFAFQSSPDAIKE